VNQARARSGRPDEGSIVVGWLVRVALVLTVLGVSAFDCVSVGAAHLNAQDDANSAATAAASDFQSYKNVDSAIAAANDAVTNPDEVVVPGSVTIGRDGSVHLRLQRKITTLVMKSIGPLKKYTVIEIEGQATAPTT
jgi:hypothetical protein